MTIEFNCSKCETLLRVADRSAGKKCRCPKCSTLLAIPAAEVALEEVAADDPPRKAKPVKGTIAAGPAVVKRKPAPPAYDEDEEEQRPDEEKKPRKGKAKRGKPKKAKGKKGLIIGGVIALGVCFLLCAGGGGLAVWYFWPSGADDFKYFPNGTQSVESLQIDQIRNSTVYKDATAAGNKDPEFDSFDKRYGISADNVERRAIGSSRGSNPESVTVIRTKTAVQASDVIAKMKQGDAKQDYTETAVGKYKVNEPKGVPAAGLPTIVFCVVDSKTIIYGQSRTVRSVLERGKKPEFSAGMQAALNTAKFRSSGTNVYYVGDSKGADAMTGGGFGFGAFGALPKVESTVTEIDVGTDVKVRTTSKFADAAAASEAKKLADDTWQKTRDNPLAKEMFADVEQTSSVSGNSLIVNARIPGKTFAKMMGKK